MANADLTAARLREILDYDQDTGVFRWKSRRSKRVKAGDIAGTAHNCGYIAITIDRSPCLAHRLAWLYVTGDWPLMQIDHFNGEKKDNRFSNLRDVNSNINAQNMRKANSRSMSGLLGVKKSACGSRWEANISFDGRHLHLGSFGSAEEASAAYIAAKRKHHSGCTL